VWSWQFQAHRCQDSIKFHILLDYTYLSVMTCWKKAYGPLSSQIKLFNGGCMPLTFDGKPVLCQQLLLTCIVYGIHAMSKHTCIVLCMVMEKKQEYQSKMCFSFSPSTEETENMFKVDITHIQSWSMCCVHVCYYPTPPIFNSGKEGESNKKIHFLITFWLWMGNGQIQLNQSWNGKMLTAAERHTLTRAFWQ
jgi:hypothetical protein